MARTKREYITVYATKEEAEVLRKLAAGERRSLSNLLLMLGLERAGRSAEQPETVTKPDNPRG